MRKILISLIGILFLLVVPIRTEAQIVISPPAGNISSICPTCITGTGSDTQVSFFTGANTLGGNGALVFQVEGTGTQYAAVTALSGPALTIGADDVNGSGAVLVLGSNGDNASPPQHLFYSSNGTNASPTASTVGTTLGSTLFYGYDGANFQNAGRIRVRVPSGGVVSAGIVPGVMEFLVLASNGSGVTAGLDGVTNAFSAPNVLIPNGGALRTNTTTAHTGLIQAYDVDDATYRTFATLTNGNTPTFNIAAPVGGLLTLSPTTLDVGGAAGVRLTAGTSSVLEMQGLGGDTENLTWDLGGTANTVVVGSASGVTNMTWTGNFSPATVTARYVSSGASPAVTDTSANSCGSGTQTIVGNDNASKVTVIGSVGTSCTVTFATAFANAPSCNVTNETTANLSRATSTASDVIVAGTFLENDVLAISCLGR